MASIIRDRRRGVYLIQWHNGTRWTRATVHKVAGWRPGKSTFPAKPPVVVELAKVEYSRRELEARRGTRAVDPGRTVAAFLGDYAAAYARERAEGSRKQLAQATRTFLGWCAGAKVAKLEAVTAAVCQRFLDWRAGQVSRKTGGPIAPARLAQERALLSGAWRRAVKLGELAANPWSATEAPGHARARKGARRAEKPSWSPEQFAALTAAARPWLRDLLTIGVNTGLRIGALLGLEWRDVRWAKDEGAGFGDIVVRPELDKAGRGYRVPISRACHDALARRFVHRDAHERHVITGDRGKPTRITTAATAIIRACKRAGLPEPRPSPTHHLRRTFGRWAILGHLTGRPVPLYVVSRWMGHSTTKMTEEYLNVNQEESRDWMAEHRPARDEDQTT